MARLSELLPPTFEELHRDFAVGVVTADGEHVLVDQGPLPQAVAASAAIPFIFSSVDVPGGVLAWGQCGLCVCAHLAWLCLRQPTVAEPFCTSLQLAENQRGCATHSAGCAGGLTGLKDGGMVDRVGLSAWRRRRRHQHQQQHRAASANMPPCLVHIIERSSPFSGADDAEASGEDNVQFVRCPKSGVNFFDLGDFERQFELAKLRASSNLETYLGKRNSSSSRAGAGSSSSSASAQMTQFLAGGSNQGQQQQQQQQARSSVVLPSARRSAAAAAAVAGTANRRSTSSVSPS